jgi:hypothetical protein
MAFTTTRLFQTVSGNQRKVVGTYANDEDSTGGDIDTGLHSVHDMVLQPTGSAVDANHPAINETLPCAGNAVTVVTTANATGIWIAYGD